ncbi:50S ribosomal protein L6 [Candidatus Pacearchaeota archaeon]|nr:50S ribosomal protein L6 [Candidatus Pacearchaeota archaeon]
MAEKHKKLIEEIELPQGISAEASRDFFILRNGSKEIKKRFTGAFIESKDGKIIMSTNRATKRERKVMKTYAAHIKNIINGLNKDFVYKLKICSVHFPMTVSVDKNSHEIIIKNFLGEKRERRAKILPNTNVEVNGADIIVSSFDIENAGQTAANIEKATKIRYRDRRIFQDGIFMTEKAGEKI